MRKNSILRIKNFLIFVQLSDVLLTLKRHSYDVFDHLEDCRGLETNALSRGLVGQIVV